MSLSIVIGGFGWERLGTQGLEIIRTIVGIATAHYPGKHHLHCIHAAFLFEDTNVFGLE